MTIPDSLTTVSLVIKRRHMLLLSLPLNWLLQDKLTDMRHQMQLTADNERKLVVARNELRPTAVHGCMLYSLLTNMPAVNHMYQMSLQQFLQILQLSLQRSFARFLILMLIKKKKYNYRICSSY